MIDFFLSTLFCTATSLFVGYFKTHSLAYYFIDINGSDPEEENTSSGGLTLLPATSHISEYSGSRVLGGLGLNYLPWGHVTVKS